LDLQDFFCEAKFLYRRRSLSIFVFEALARRNHPNNSKSNNNKNQKDNFRNLKDLFDLNDFFCEANSLKEALTRRNHSNFSKSNNNKNQNNLEMRWFRDFEIFCWICRISFAKQNSSTEGGAVTFLEIRKEHIHKAGAWASRQPMERRCPHRP
jgi:hypothetical protein